MATAAIIPVSEYLRTSGYEPDAEYVAGYIEKRPMGEHDHSCLQRKLLLLLSQTSMEASFLCYPERRVQVAVDRFRVPDLVLVRREVPKEKIIVTPPLLCIEILSPEDRMSRTLIRVREFLAMGIPEIWIVDGESRTVQVCNQSRIVEHASGALAVPLTDFELDMRQIFSALD